MNHPIHRFTPPRSIQRGQALKDLLDERLVGLIGQSFADAMPGFPVARFTRAAVHGLAVLELSERARHIAQAVEACLPPEPEAAMDVVVRSLGPPLLRTDEIGLQPFFYLPHSQLLASLGPQSVAAGLDACHALTRRFTAEFCIRPLLLSDQRLVLERLAQWCDDPDAHVRRLVSEGTRPRLPWAPRLPAFVADPTPTLTLLERLRHDHDRYVQRSVANHLGDIAKDHLDLVLMTCERWLDEDDQRGDGRGDSFGNSTRRDLHWLIRHALRHPDKKGDPRARTLRLQAGGKHTRTPTAR